MVRRQPSRALWPRLVEGTFAIIGPDAPDAALRFAGRLRSSTSASVAVPGQADDDRQARQAEARSWLCLRAMKSLAVSTATAASRQ